MIFFRMSRLLILIDDSLSMIGVYPGTTQACLKFLITGFSFFGAAELNFQTFSDIFGHSKIFSLKFAGCFGGV